MSERPRVLTVSRNRELMLLRAQVLKAFCCEAVTTDTHEETISALESQQFDALVICHTIPDELAAEYAERFRSKRPNGCVVYVAKTPYAGKKRYADIAVSGISGPEALIEAVTSCQER